MIGAGRIFGAHLRFFGAAACGVAVWFATAGQHGMLRLLLAADVFFALFVAQAFYAGIALQPDDLRIRVNRISRAAARIMVLLAAAAVVVSLVAVFALLNHPKEEGRFFPIVAVASVPLSWAMIHTIAALYYARLYYASEKWGVPEGGLAFPEGGLPSALDFFYHAFAIGASSSVSDVNTTERDLRLATFIHSLASFAFNTVLIAILVNAAMTFASG